MVHIDAPGPDAPALGARAPAAPAPGGAVPGGAVLVVAGDEPDPAARSGRRRLPVLVVAGVVLLGAAGTGVYLAARATAQQSVMTAPTWRAASTPVRALPPAATGEPAPEPSPTPYVPPSYAMKGPGTYVYATGISAVLGTAGPLRTYRVAVETGVPVPVREFADLVEATLGDPRSWIAGNAVRLQQVAGDVPASFTVRLVTPGTAADLCAAVGLGIYWHGEPYTSCQAGPQAVINLSRYLKSIPDYGAPLLTYQQYAINHEVGHVLGHGHEKCPGAGQPAPVMQQQTFGLLGCVANSWPYLNGRRYAGPPGTVVPN